MIAHKTNVFLARLGLGSARGRYLYTAGLFGLLLLSFSWLGQSHIQILIERQITNISELIGVANDISKLLWLLTLAGIGVIAAGFLLFESTLRIPVTRIVRALKAETQEMKEIHLSKTNATEINELLDALNDMRLKSRRHKQDLEILLDESLAAVLSVDKNGIVTIRNPRTSEIFGCESAELDGLHINQLVRDVFSIETDKNGVVSIILNPPYLDGNRHETIGTRKNKEEFFAWVRVKQSVLDTEPVHIVRVRDITQRKAMENELNAHQRYLELLQDVTPAAIFTVNQNGIIEAHNPNSEQIFGYSKSELNGLPIHQLIPRLYSKETDQNGFASIAHNIVYDMDGIAEIAGIRKNNQEFPIGLLIKEAAIGGKPVYMVRARDITKRKKMQNELKSREQHLQILLDISKAALLTIDQNGLIQTFNTHATHTFGYEGPELTNLSIDQLLPQVFSKEKDRDGTICPILDPLYLDGEMHETTIVSKNKMEFPATIMVRKTVLDGKPGHIIRARDITDKKAMEAKLNSRQQRLETILQNAAEGILTFDHHGMIESFNNAAEKLFGYKEQEIVGQPFNLLIPAGARDAREGYLEHFMRAEIKRLVGRETEVTGRHKDGTKFPMALKISTLTLGGKQLYTGLVADISERKALVEHLKNMAEHDGLTGLYNRGYFQSELERVVERARRAGNQSYALLYIDLDNFKYVNDTLGHAAGDRVLIEVAAILNKRARKSDLIARLGGDEFAVLLYDTTPKLATQVAESFREQMMNYTLKQDGQRVDIGCSIGVSLITSATKSAAESMSQADIACHFAKREGRNRVHLFKPADEAGFVSMSLDMGWSRRIREAIKDDRFALACQPIIHTQTGRVESYEVLIRLLDDNDELIMPGGFLPAAERFGLSADIDKWVIVHAIDALAERHEQMPSLRYSINLSGQTLSDLSVADLIAAKLKATGLDPSALIFEVTETAAIADMTVAETFLSRLQEIGCKTALDDFGSGFSSFAYLQDLPVDSVKIDGRFVKNLANSSVDQAMVKAMNDIAHALGKETVAEFVENEESMKLLREYGVDSAQGYHLGRPDMMRPYKTEVDLGKKSKQRKRM
jgi:diguanylate cyclase (GGDEF)-like protein/PAS domain S-box-containing protein